jgi:hypothetical protein
MPGIPIAVAGGPVGSTQHLELSEADGYRAKIIALQESPFDTTVLLDADTYVLRDLSEIFELLERFDMCAAHAPNRVTVTIPGVSRAFPEFNTGVIGLRRNERTDQLLTDWLRLYDEMLPDQPPSSDQPAFRRAVYAAADLRFTVLPPEFNQRFAMAGLSSRPPRILHGWADRARYERIARALTTREDTDDWRVFAGLLVFDRDGRRVGNYGPRLRRIRRPLRPLKRTVCRLLGLV